MKALVLFFTLMPLLPALAAGEGQLRLYRWSPGLKAEREPALEIVVTEGDLKALLEAPAAFVAGHPENLFPGCYLAAFTKAPAGRAPASAEEKPRYHKVCTSARIPPAE